MTNLSDFVRRLVDVLEGLGLPYMFVGSAASTLHGPPRSTQDIDLVVALTLKDAPRLLAAFPDDGYYVSAEAVRDAVLRRYSFNIIDLESGWKADIMVLKARPFSRVEFERRQRADVLGSPSWVATAEDTILAKLEWSQLAGGSARQRDDVLGMIEAQGKALDIDYLNHWASALGVKDALYEALTSVRGRRESDR
jgi:hypothetical protein